MSTWQKEADGAVLDPLPLSAEGWSSWLQHKHGSQPSLPALAGLPRLPTELSPAGDKGQAQSSSPGVQGMPQALLCLTNRAADPQEKMPAPRLQMPPRMCNQLVEKPGFF